MKQDKNGHLIEENDLIYVTGGNEGMYVIQKDENDILKGFILDTVSDGVILPNATIIEFNEFNSSQAEIVDMDAVRKYFGVD